MSDLDDLAAFLLAQIGDEERLAQTIQARGRWAWRQIGDASIYSLSDDMELSPYFSIDLSRGCVYPTASVMEHIRLHDPARVLAECEARRALVLELARMLRDEAGWDGIEEKVMGYLALPYADHEQYRQEWRP